jgi:hypothetical protein
MSGVMVYTSVMRYDKNGRIYRATLNDSGGLIAPLQRWLVGSSFPDSSSISDTIIEGVTHYHSYESKYAGSHIESLRGRTHLVYDRLTLEKFRQDSAGIVFWYYTRTSRSTFAPDLGYTIRAQLDDEDSSSFNHTHYRYIKRVDSVRVPTQAFI